MLVFVVITGVFAGCSQKREITPVDTPFAIYCKTEDIVLKVGDKIEDVEPIIGPIASREVEFAEFGYFRVEYHETDGVYLDHKPDGDIFGLRFESKDWQLANGLTIGSQIEDVKNSYPETELFKYDQTEDLWVAYDEKGNIVDFSEDVPYIIRFKIRDGVVTMVVIKDNSMGVGIF